MQSSYLSSPAQIATQISNASLQPPTPILNTISDCLQRLMERAAKLHMRQVGISTRVFGERPEQPYGKEAIQPGGLHGGIEAQLNRLESILSDIESETSTLERIA